MKLDELRKAVAGGTVDTVLLTIADMEGRLQGKRLTGQHFLDAKVYFITDLPALVEWSDVLKISLTSFVLCCISTLYPSWRAARTQPAQSLRHD